MRLENLACWTIALALFGCDAGDRAETADELPQADLPDGGSTAGKKTLRPDGGIGDGERIGARSGSPGSARDEEIELDSAGDDGDSPSDDLASAPRPAPAAAPSGGGPTSSRGASAAESSTSAEPSRSTGSAPIVGSPGGTTAPSISIDAGMPVVPPRAAPAGTLTAGTWDDNLNLDHFQAYLAKLASQPVSGRLPFSSEEVLAAKDASAQPKTAQKRLDIALVVDTTGSMGDEIRYLQTEFDAISHAIETRYPGSEQRWALVLYRDTSDAYLVRYFDFRTDPAAFREKLAAQSATGGGDFPEAPQVAFEVLNQFAWRADADVARVAIWVADAPHHAVDADKLAQGVRDARSQGIHVYPVASSGVDEFTEHTMRSTAQLTGGRYLFLTDDSRVGGSHKEPSIPCYFVTKLDDALLRVIDAEMSGSVKQPASADIVRTVGSPVDGKCLLGSGQNVIAF